MPKCAAGSGRTSCRAPGAGSHPRLQPDFATRASSPLGPCSEAGAGLPLAQGRSVGGPGRGAAPPAAPRRSKQNHLAEPGLGRGRAGFCGLLVMQHPPKDACPAPQLRLAGSSAPRRGAAAAVPGFAPRSMPNPTLGGIVGCAGAGHGSGSSTGAFGGEFGTPLLLLLRPVPAASLPRSGLYLPFLTLNFCHGCVFPCLPSREARQRVNLLSRPPPETLNNTRASPPSSRQPRADFVCVCV